MAIEAKPKEVKPTAAKPTAAKPTAAQVMDAQFPAPNAYELAMQKSLDPAMTLVDNPLVTESTPAIADAQRMQDRNMTRLEEDRRFRRTRGTGSIYAGIMQTRFGGGGR